MLAQRVHRRAVVRLGRCVAEATPHGATWRLRRDVVQAPRPRSRRMYDLRIKLSESVRGINCTLRGEYAAPSLKSSCMVHSGKVRSICGFARHWLASQAPLASLAPLHGQGWPIVLTPGSVTQCFGTPPHMHTDAMHRDPMAMPRDPMVYVYVCEASSTQKRLCPSRRLNRQWFQRS